MAHAIHKQQEARLAQIGAAESIIADGEYGYCVQTGGPIKMGRLKVDPPTSPCLEAARAAEAQRH